MPATARRLAVAVTPHHQRGWELGASYAAITWGVTGAVRKTTDPGRALLTGKWKDIGKFKGPVLRGLALGPTE